MSVLRGENKSSGNCSFGFLPKGELKWTALSSQNISENSPLHSFSLEMSPATVTTSTTPEQQGGTMTPGNAHPSSGVMNVDSSPLAILTPLNRVNVSSLSTPDLPLTHISAGRQDNSLIANTLTTTDTNTEQKAVNKRVRLVKLTLSCLA